MEEKIMNMAEMCVCDAGGLTTDVGARVPADSVPYMFYALNGNTRFIVTILMPLGGTQSGLFRFPKVGEKVLVAHESGTTGYLLGYVPSNAQAFDIKSNDMNALIENQGEVFRYQQTGKATGKIGGGARYSEIGFYNEQTAWKAASPADYQSGESENPPKVDRLNIQSTGDIHQCALNHQSINAKRFEILVDCDEVNHATGKTAQGKRPFGDRAEDDSSLYAGDAHIRAKNRIVIKAGEEIRLQVGRSVLVITDEGIVLNSRKSHSNLTTPWDTILALSARNGVSVSGERVSIGAAHGFSISESWGASIKSLGGVMRLSGKDVKLTAEPAKAYLASTIAVSGQFTSAVTAIGLGIANKDSGSALKNTLPSLVGAGANVAGLLGSAAFSSLNNTVPSPSDTVGLVATVIGIVQTILHQVVYTAVDMLIESKDEYDRDKFDLAAMVLDYGTMLPLVTAIFVKSAFKPVHNSYLHLTTDASAVMGGFKTMRHYVENDDAAGPLAGCDPPPTWSTGAKVVTAVAMGLPLLMLAGIGGWKGGTAAFNKYGVVQTTDAATLAALEEL
jgi:hypothetical protein